MGIMVSFEQTESFAMASVPTQSLKLWTNTLPESSNWHEQIDTYIDDLDGEDVLVSVDYHM